MLTITNKEFNKIYSDASAIYRAQVYNLCRSNMYGIEICGKEFKKIKELFLYLTALTTWKQGEFDDNYHFNYLKKEDIYNIYTKIKKLR